MDSAGPLWVHLVERHVWRDVLYSHRGPRAPRVRRRALAVGRPGGGQGATVLGGPTRGPASLRDVLVLRGGPVALAVLLGLLELSPEEDGVGDGVRMMRRCRALGMGGAAVRLVPAAG